MCLPLKSRYIHWEKKCSQMNPLRWKGLGFYAILHQIQDIFALKDSFETFFFTQYRLNGSRRYTIFSQFQTTIKFNLILISLRGKRILFILSISFHEHVKQNNRAECKPRIEMGKMVVIGPIILRLQVFFLRGRGRLIYAHWL